MATKFKDPFDKPEKREPEERERKSWREIDARRDGSAHAPRREPSGADKREEKRLKGAAYQGYKRDLDKLFTGAELPDYLKSMLPELPKDEAKAGQLKLLGAITAAQTQAELEEAVAAYLAVHQEFPCDADLLLRVLDYPDEAVQLRALRQAEAIANVTPLPHKRQYALKTQSLAMTADDDDLRELAEVLAKSWR